MKEEKERTVRAHKNGDGIMIYRLLQGECTRGIFGYGTCHGIWLEIGGWGTETVSMVAESSAKEQIRKWCQ